MKADIHPIYHKEAPVKCACGNSWTTGSVKPELSISICSNCHPFYTGQEKILDTRGRVEKTVAKTSEAKPKKTRK